MEEQEERRSRLCLEIAKAVSDGFMLCYAEVVQDYETSALVVKVQADGLLVVTEINTEEDKPAQQVLVSSRDESAALRRALDRFDAVLDAVDGGQS